VALPAVLAEAGAVLVSDYGRGVAADPAVRNALAGALARGIPVVWDPHPKGAPPVPGGAVATPNLAEAQRAGGLTDAPAAVAGRAVLDRWCCSAIVVTAGSAGAVLVRTGRAPLTVPAPEVSGGDPCGAGDAFAGALASELAAGSALAQATESAVRAAARFVRAGGAGAVGWTGHAWRQSAPVLW
jgi:bifunctional ADP-heptose synthase (sugar kinase/adenylyltransferase)